MLIGTGERPEVISERLEAIANWMADNSGGQPPTAKTLLQASILLRRMGASMCGGGVIGCYGGPECNSDHKSLNAG